MCEALQVQARYDSPDASGETRRERNERFGVESPNFEPPKEGRYLWLWFVSAARTRRYDQGTPQPLTPQEWIGWAQISGEMVRREEYLALMEMDRTYCASLSREISEQRRRESESQRGNK